MRQIRRLHHYFGVFLAPTILFFALSGALQTFRLHEAKGWGGPPPQWLAVMGNIHKDQELSHAKAKPQKPAPAPVKPADAHDADGDHHEDADHHEGAAVDSALLLKIFVVLVAVGLMFSTILGVIIALNNSATRRASVTLLVAGTILPALLLIL